MVFVFNKERIHSICISRELLKDYLKNDTKTIYVILLYHLLLVLEFQPPTLIILLVGIKPFTNLGRLLLFPLMHEVLLKFQDVQNPYSIVGCPK